MAVEDVVVALRRRTRPDVGHRIAQLLHIVHVAEQDLVVDGRTVLARTEEVNRVEVGDVDASGVRCRALRSVFLDVHAEETDIDAVHLLEGEQSLGPVRELLHHLTGLDEATPHSRLHLHTLVRRADHPDMHLARSRLLLFEEIVHPGLDVDTELGGGQALGVELVLLPLRVLLLQAVITHEAAGPDRVQPEDADLVLLAATLLAVDKRLQLQVVVLHLLELVLFDLTAKCGF